VRPHAIVHGGHKQHRCFGREQARAQQVVGLTRRRARHEVSGRGCDDDELSGSRQVNVVKRVACLNQLGVNRSAGQRLERYGPDEFSRRPREHHIDFRRRLREQPRQPR